jgi:probable HAF family extracellular repeat protein
MWIRATFSALLLCLPSTLASAQSYAVTDLGSLMPNGINSWAQVVGSRNSQAVVWTKWGGTKYLGEYPGGTFSTATAINDLGQIVGMGDLPPAQCDGGLLTQTVAFRWTAKGVIQELGTAGIGGFDPCVFDSLPMQINLRGQVAGVNGKPSTSYVDPFRWTKSTGVTLLPNIYNGAAYGINNQNQIVGAVGYFDNMNPQEHPDNSAYATLWDAQGNFTELPSLFEAGDYNCSMASDINDRSQIVGWSNSTADCFNAFTPHALLWTNAGAMHDLGTLPGATTSVAHRINFFGQVIGSSDGVPFIWTLQSGMRDLNKLINPSSGWVLGTATGINFWGQIVGQGLLNGQPHGFLLTPTDFSQFK